MTKLNPSEKDVKKDVKKVLDAHKVFWWMPPNNGYGKSGISDFNGLRTNVFFAIETKEGKNMPTALQTGFLSSIKAEGGFAFVVNERSVSYLKTFFEAYDRANTAALVGRKPSNEDGSIMLNCIKVLEELWIGGTYDSFDKLLKSQMSDGDDNSLAGEDES